MHRLFAYVSVIKDEMGSMDQEEIYRRAVELVDKARGKLEVRSKVGAADLD